MKCPPPAVAIMSDDDALLGYLAWRDERLAGYDDYAQEPCGELKQKPCTACDALLVFGSAMACVPIGAADLFVDVLYPAGCRTVVMSGGVGRGTLALWRELAERRLTARFGCDEPWPVNGQPAAVQLPAQSLSKPVLAAADVVPSEASKRLRYCSEADIMLELFVDRCKQRGVSARYAGDPMASVGESADEVMSCHDPSDGAGARVYLESASTNSGENCALSAQTLASLGIDATTAAVAIVQHPQAHLRACLTWEKQLGKLPMGWCPRPSSHSLGVSDDEMLLYALGELRRIEAYSDPSKAFLVMPPDFPREQLSRLAGIETDLRCKIHERLCGGGPTAYAASLGIEMSVGGRG